MEPLTLARNCGNCAHFDGDMSCSLPFRQALVRGPIADANLVVCAKHEEREDDRKDAINHAIAKQAADDERSLYRFARY